MSEITEQYEYIVAQKAEGKWIGRRIGLIALYVCLPILILTLIYVFAKGLLPLFALAAVGEFVLIFFTWRYVAIEYEYSIQSAKLTFTIIRNAFNHRLRSEQAVIAIRDFALIAPVNDPMYADKRAAFGAEKTYYAWSSEKADDRYFALFTDSEGKKCELLFIATSDALKRMRFYNKEATVVVQTRL